MASLPGIIGLLVFLYMRPQEFLAPLRDLNFLYVCLALCIAGILYDLSRRTLVLQNTPALGLASAFALWCIATLGVRRPDLITKNSVVILICFLLYGILAHGVQRLQSLYRVTITIFALGIFVAAVGAHQGTEPFSCVSVDPTENNGRAYPDGRECAFVEPDGTPHDGLYDCYSTGVPGVVYGCEHVGLFGTTSIGGGRVRYLGVLQDPNELALATALAVPFAFALLEIRRTLLRVLLLAFTLVVVAVETLYTQSRGGQLTFAAVLSAYFVKRFGWKRGAIVAAVLAGPLLVLGGRKDDSADESTLERLGCAAAGIKMIMSYPITGVGYSQFTEHHSLTAHNAFILAAGELGAVGMWLFASILYLSLKIPVRVLQFDLPADGEALVTKAMAMAILAVLIGACVGIFFLSWTYHYVLWLHLGLAGGLYSVVKRKAPAFEVRYSWRERAYILFGYVAFLVVWARYIRMKGAWD